MQIAETTNANSTRFQYKVVLLGDAGVGKTSLIRRFCFNDFIMDTQETIGLRFHSMTIPAIQERKYICYRVECLGFRRARTISIHIAPIYHRGECCFISI